MSKKRRRKNNKRNTNKYANYENQVSQRKGPRQPKKSSAEKIFEVSDEIFGGQYYCVGDK